MIAASISISSILILGAGVIYYALKARDAKDDLFSANHLKKIFKDSFNEADQLNTVNNLLLEHIHDELENGVFYDKVNNTVVVIDNLEKIGDL